MYASSEIHDGMTVRSRDGEKLGKIVRCENDVFVIERGLFFPKDYMARYDEVVDVRDTDVYIALNKDDLVSNREAAEGSSFAKADAESRDDMPIAEASSSSTMASRSTTETTSMPLAEEQLSAEKRVEQAGEVRIHKDVITEQQQITVPVSHEEVRVERVASGEPAPVAGDPSFQKEEIRIPIREERVEVQKTPVVTEEVRISKQGVTEEKTLSGEVRKEVADVRKEGNIREREVPPSTDGTTKKSN